MSLIEFQDYPSTETPLNAENLNHNFNELNQGNTYSTEETFTGRYWIDGKPLYRKVLQFTYTSAGTHNESLSDLDFDYITIKDFQCKTGNFRLKFYGSSSSSDNVNIFINGNNLSIINGGSWANAVFIVILEYTKTTD